MRLKIRMCGVFTADAIADEVCPIAGLNAVVEGGPHIRSGRPFSAELREGENNAWPAGYAASFASDSRLALPAGAGTAELLLPAEKSVLQSRAQFLS
jgi:hypothetical protein